MSKNVILNTAKNYIESGNIKKTLKISIEYLKQEVSNAQNILQSSSHLQKNYLN